MTMPYMRNSFKLLFFIIVALGLGLEATACFELPKEEQQDKTALNFDNFDENYLQALRKRQLTPAFVDKELMRFTILPDSSGVPAQSMLFSLRQKTQNYEMDARYYLCVSDCNRSCELDCKAAYEDQIDSYLNLINNILNNPRLRDEQLKAPKYFFQHYNKPDLLISGGGKDIFALELALAFLRMHDSNRDLIRYFEYKKGNLLFID